MEDHIKGWLLCLGAWGLPLDPADAICSQRVDAGGFMDTKACHSTING